MALNGNNQSGSITSYTLDMSLNEQASIGSQKLQKRQIAALLSCVMKQQNNNAMLCSMSTQPQNQLSVILGTSQNDLLFSPCLLVYTNANWNIPQTVNLNPIYNYPSYLNSTSVTIDYSIVDPGEVYDSYAGMQQFSRSVDSLAASGICKWSKLDSKQITQGSKTTFMCSLRMDISLIRNKQMV